MTGSAFTVTIDDQGTIDQVIKRLAAVPDQIKKAEQLTLVRLKDFVLSQVAKAVASATGATQKAFKAIGRVRANSRGDGTLVIWIGTNAISASRLGEVTWTRRMKGAKAGRRLFPGSWSWGPGSATSTAIMRRTGKRKVMTKGRYKGKEREVIEKVMVDISDAVNAKMEALLPQIAKRYDRLMRQQLRYVVQIANK